MIDDSRWASSTIRFNRSSNSPRYLVPAKIEPISKAIIKHPSKKSGTFSVKINWAKPSATAVFPTPGSPIRTGLFLVRRARTATTSSISFSRPITGSNFPSTASLVIFSANSSRVGVGLDLEFRSNKNFSA